MKIFQSFIWILFSLYFFSISQIVFSAPKPIFKKDINLKNVTAVRLVNHSGKIIINKSDSASMHIKGTLDPDSSGIKTVVKDSILNVKIQLKKHKTPNSGSQLEVSLPANTNLILEGVHTQWIASDMGTVNVTSMDGAITLNQIGGDVVIHTVDSKISLEQIQDRIEIHSLSGEIILKNVLQDVLVETVNANISLQQAQLKKVSLSNNIGDIMVSGVVNEQGVVKINNVEGVIQLLTGESPSVEYQLTAPHKEDKADKLHQINKLETKKIIVGGGDGKVIVSTIKGKIQFQ